VKLIWLTQARVEFRNIAEGIAVEHVQAANEFERRVTTAVGHLQAFPDAGRRGYIKGTREVVIYGYPYILVYRTQGDCLQVLTVRHAAREWPESLIQED
jgi:plasmid stabilization system protein ParE